MSGEMLTAIFAALTQAESESISAKVRWGYKQRMEAGTFNTCKAKLLDVEKDTTLQSTQDILDILESGPDFRADFDGELFGELVEKIIVQSNERIIFRLKNGLELPETIERTVR